MRCVRVSFEAINIQADMTEQTLLNTRVKDSLTGIHWVDALQFSGPQVLTYGLFLLYFSSNARSSVC